MIRFLSPLIQKGQVVNESIKTEFFLIKPSSLLLMATSSKSPARDLTRPTFPPFRRAKMLSRGLASRVDLDATVDLAIDGNGHGAKALAIDVTERSVTAVDILIVQTSAIKVKSKKKEKRWLVHFQGLIK